MTAINGKKYEFLITASNGKVFVTFNGNVSFSEIALIGDNPTIESINGVLSNVGSLESIEKINGKIRAVWGKTELEIVKEERQSYFEKLENVRKALVNLLTGIPTISEYATFVKTVKEVLGIE